MDFLVQVLHHRRVAGADSTRYAGVTKLTEGCRFVDQSVHYISFITVGPTVHFAQCLIFIKGGLHQFHIWLIRQSACHGTVDLLDALGTLLLTEPRQLLLAVGQDFLDRHLVVHLRVNRVQSELMLLKGFEDFLVSLAVEDACDNTRHVRDLIQVLVTALL